MAFVTTLIIVGFIAFLVYVQRQKELKANPLGPLVSRAATYWNGAPPEIRSFMLDSCGVTIPTRSAVMQSTWFALPVQVQTELLRLQMTSEFAIANDPDLFSPQSRSTGDKNGTTSTNAGIALNPVKGDSNARKSRGYIDAFFTLAMNLSRTIPLTEWATGTPKTYNIRETINIDETKLALEKLPFRSQSRFVLEPLEKLVAEIGLINSARELREFSKQDWEETFPPEGDEWENDATTDELEETVSTYLKAWLCNSSPFVLIELAYLLIQVGRLAEARETVEVVQMFPSYAANRALSQWDLIAQSMVHELIPLGPGRDARSFGESLYSPNTVALLRTKSETVQQRLLTVSTREIRSEPVTPHPDMVGASQEKRDASDFEVMTGMDPRLDPQSDPTPERVQEMFEAWKEGRLEEMFQGQEDHLYHPNLAAAKSLPLE